MFMSTCIFDLLSLFFLFCCSTCSCKQDTGLTDFRMWELISASAHTHLERFKKQFSIFIYVGQTFVWFLEYVCTCLLFYSKKKAYMLHESCFFTCLPLLVCSWAARTDPCDVARLESKTVICTPEKSEVVPEGVRSGKVKNQLARWMKDVDMDREMDDRMIGCMKGKYHDECFVTLMNSVI